MAGETVKFRVRTAQYEVEFEGPSETASSRYDAMISRLDSESLPPLSADSSGSSVHDGYDKPKSKRGGIRSSVIAKGVDTLIVQEWLKPRRTESEIFQELQNRRVPGVDRRNLKVALDRRVRIGKLQSIQDGDAWVFWSAQ